MTKLCLVGLAVLAAAFLILAGASRDGWAKQNLEQTNPCRGMVNCLAWCDAHNKTRNSQQICKHNCHDYWSPIILKKEGVNGCAGKV